MTHFNFIISDIDAENLFGALSTEISIIQDSITDEISKKNRQTYINAYKDRLKYIEKLIKKMKNKKV